VPAGTGRTTPTNYARLRGGSGSAQVGPPYDAVDTVVGLACTLRAAGVGASPERVQAAVQAVAALDPARHDDVYWACRLTLCASDEEIRRFDVAFAAYFGDRPGTIVRRQRLSKPALRVIADGSTPPGDGEGDGEQVQGAATASSVEQLRHRDVSRMSADERAQLRRLLALLQLPGEARSTRRKRAASRGAVDPDRTLRAWLRAGGEPAALRRHRAATRPRRVVLLVDVSGSMDSYADALLRFAHAAARRGRAQTEVFVLGTRLSRVTREMAHRDPDVALGLVNEVCPDAGGGTRLGVLLKEFLDRWGQRGTARGAVVVILSDGWERDDPTLLGEQVARLSRLAHRVVWANPRKAAPGFTPVAGGMAAALPHVDDFVEGHSLAAYERLAAVVLGRERAPVRPRTGAARA